MDIIVYGSQYGSAKRYAEELARRTGIVAKEYSDVVDINAYKTIVYIGSLYAGGVRGMKKTLARLDVSSIKKLVIATVGLADPTDEENTANIKKSMRAQLNQDVFNEALIFHLRGAIDYKTLGLTHKTMMRLLVNKTKKIPEEKRNAEVRAMIETYDKQVDFVDFNNLDQIIQVI